MDRWEGGEKTGKKVGGRGEEEKEGMVDARKSEILDKHCGALVYLCKMDQEGGNNSDLTPLVRKISSALSSLCNVGGW